MLCGLVEQCSVLSFFRAIYVYTQSLCALGQMKCKPLLRDTFYFCFPGVLLDSHFFFFFLFGNLPRLVSVCAVLHCHFVLPCPVECPSAGCAADMPPFPLLFFPAIGTDCPQRRLFVLPSAMRRERRGARLGFLLLLQREGTVCGVPHCGCAGHYPLQPAVRHEANL
ncbi:hypothetical protein Tc00.1047053510479.30 [Trypanosoma cruzi]|uniref:Uncharacterized protein n=1 Tax=Trypanosoma cruzi (strain CL Brener) TaxID=353153 RepID=Q4CN12_TRYCC|nr:hypothetical protein Tc00.1047053510479.30 [Trypanosoma cruzi]EAN81664.1 hypothetical protein Tc00.1047053510479.30 [Trypanosoma cruzi]|eukprot:XP_803110.1 hypothetical protein [Trypanosoma cruzi strain CL Brener]